MAKDNKQPQQTNGGAATMTQPATAANDPRVLAKKSWDEQAEAYLTDRGWEKVSDDPVSGAVWSDPRGSLAAARFTKVVELPTREGGVEKFRQASGPPVPWNYTTREAYLIQKQRDADDPDAATPLQKLNKLEAQHDKVVRAAALARGKVESILKRVAPDKGENQLKAEIVALRRLIGEVSNELGRALPEGVRQTESVITQPTKG